MILKRIIYTTSHKIHRININENAITYSRTKKSLTINHNLLSYTDKFLPICINIKSIGNINQINDYTLSYVNFDGKFDESLIIKRMKKAVLRLKKIGRLRINKNELHTYCGSCLFRKEYTDNNIVSQYGCMFNRLEKFEKQNILIPVSSYEENDIVTNSYVVNGRTCSAHRSTSDGTYADKELFEKTRKEIYNINYSHIIYLDSSQEKEDIHHFLKESILYINNLITKPLVVIVVNNKSNLQKSIIRQELQNLINIEWAITSIHTISNKIDAIIESLKNAKTKIISISSSIDYFSNLTQSDVNTLLKFLNEELKVFLYYNPKNIGPVFTYRDFIQDSKSFIGSSLLEKAMNYQPELTIT